MPVNFMSSLPSLGTELRAGRDQNNIKRGSIPSLRCSLKAQSILRHLSEMVSAGKDARPESNRCFYWLRFCSLRQAIEARSRAWASLF